MVQDRLYSLPNGTAFLQLTLEDGDEDAGFE